MHLNHQIKKLLFKFVLAGITVLAVYGSVVLYRQVDFLSILSQVNQQTGPFLFVTLMTVLPLFGFPINIFLVLSGLKLGLGYALLTWMLILALHAVSGFYLAGMLREFLQKLLTRRLGYAIPRIPAQRTAWFTFLFFLVPGLPYAAKNYVLPVAGVPFRYCVWMNIALQGALGIPVIILGQSAASKDFSLFFVALFILAAAYFSLRILKKRVTVPVDPPARFLIGGQSAGLCKSAAQRET